MNTFLGLDIIEDTEVLGWVDRRHADREIIIEDGKPRTAKECHEKWITSD